MNREAFFVYLADDSMHESHLRLLRNISEHVDDETLSAEILKYLKDEHGSIDDCADKIENTFEFLSEITYHYGNDDKERMARNFLNAAKEEFAHIQQTFIQGFEEEATEMMRDVADAMFIIQTLPNYEYNTEFLRDMEDQIRELIQSGRAESWFDYDPEPEDE
ncbi:MAG: hypothetical protein IKC93_06060 [Candidatus Methanomethylophilaceae archaeon]|nr:hypothetical protein [Candidatus Methanomethylophilaceae archaeon]